MERLSEINVLPILESLTYIKKNHASVVRFGDGEIDLMTGHSIPYQEHNDKLAKKLKQILQTKSDENLLVCLPDVFSNMERYNQNAQIFWEGHFLKYSNFYLDNCNSPFYGSTFISRPYIDLVDKSVSETYFSSLKELWKEKDILIVEGATSRSGVGNDLFSEASSIKRIICPSKNAFQYYDEIFQEIEKHGKDRLILIMLGPTAKILVSDLARQGYQAIDLGHIDSEYEWYEMGATYKVKLTNKHTAEFNHDEGIELELDQKYQQQIIARIGVGNFNEIQVEKEEEMDTSELISVIVPVYNVEQYLKRCLDSLLKQSYENFEILLVNDGSTDSSSLICEDYAKRDERIRVFHQMNAGPSAARNTGITFATGKYITFIDSDDFVEETYLEHLYRALVDNDSDISICNFNSFNEERQSFLFSITKEKYFSKNYTVAEWMNQESSPNNNLFLTFTFSPTKLFKAELFDGIRFPIGRLREDDATIYRLYLKAKQVTFINEGSYYYSQRKEGLSRTRMLDDISSMITNAEERIALLAAMGYDLTEQIKSYKGRLKKCREDALRNGQLELYQQCCNKLDLIENYSKEK